MGARARGPRSRSKSEERTVLVVEDDEDLLGTYELWLAGCEDVAVRTALDGEAALAAVDDDVDALVLDRRLPALSGPEVLNRLDGDRPVVVVSAYQPDAHVCEDDVTAYLVKPVTRERFLDAVRRALL
ncbi:response regulator [Halogeometricum sp. S1BR25-6]|uniref:Response regulator n=1 Tax=Halogeometricum salsisoli TaxID=2950536 RepID=A0ABU2GBI7_9EURY|nr:response regulator [Halogeometricum sp. S1BR25-6]MDS0298160.1 response regulator [Halogeometricum sp. S1BR25-6]